MTAKAVFRCAKCNGSSPFDVHKVINTGEDPSLKGRVLDGSLFIWQCPECGAKNLASYPTLYHDPQKKLMIVLASDTEDPRIEALGDDLSQKQGYVFRKVKSTGALVETVNIIEAGLDDAVVRMMKFVCAKENGITGNALLRFSGIVQGGTSGESAILFSYPRDGEMASVRVSAKTYRDCEDILSRNPDMRNYFADASI